MKSNQPSIFLIGNRFHVTLGILSHGVVFKTVRTFMCCFIFEHILVVVLRKEHRFVAPHFLAFFPKLPNDSLDTLLITTVLIFV